MVSNGLEQTENSTPQTIPQLCFSRAEAAKATRLSEKTIDRAIRSGVLRAIRVNRRTLISHDSLQEFLSFNHSIPSAPSLKNQVLKQVLQDSRAQGLAF